MGLFSLREEAGWRKGVGGDWKGPNLDFEMEKEIKSSECIKNFKIKIDSNNQGFPCWNCCLLEKIKIVW